MMSKVSGSQRREDRLRIGHLLFAICGGCKRSKLITSHFNINRHDALYIPPRPQPTSSCTASTSRGRQKPLPNTVPGRCSGPVSASSPPRSASSPTDPSVSRPPLSPFVSCTHRSARPSAVHVQGVAGGLDRVHAISKQQPYRTSRVFPLDLGPTIADASPVSRPTTTRARVWSSSRSNLAHERERRFHDGRGRQGRRGRYGSGAMGHYSRLFVASPSFSTGMEKQQIAFQAGCGRGLGRFWVWGTDGRCRNADMDSRAARLSSHR